MKKTKLLHIAGPLLSLVLFALSLWVLHRELKAYHIQDIIRDFQELPAGRLMPGMIFTLLSYFVMTGYDVLALRYIKYKLAYRKIVLASFIAYAFSTNLGLSGLAGGSVRYRLYSTWGLSALEITRVVAFCSVGFWLGFLLLSGAVFLLEPMAIPLSLHIPFGSVRPLGVVFVGAVTAYFLWTALWKRPLKFFGWEFSLPSVRLFIAQVAVALFDWALSGAVLYSLLPHVSGLSFPQFLGMYMLAQMAGVVSQVPGGLGVFDTIVLLLLGSRIPASQVLGALLAYRVLYYLLPLGLAALLLGIQEIGQRKEKLRLLARISGEHISVMVPNVLAFTTFLGGAILLFSGATPSVGWRLLRLKDFLPLPLLEISHFLGSLAGVALLLLARGLQRRLDAAYVITAVLLGCGIAFSLLKGLDYEEAIILSVMLAVLLPCRHHFYRKASLLSSRFNGGWIAAIAIVLLCSIWLGMFSHKHVEYSSDLWWRFTFSGNAPRFLRASVGAVGIALFFSMARLLRPSPPKPELPASEALEKARGIAKASTSATANLALLGDKKFLFNEKGNAFIMYGIEGRSWIAMGDPIGPVEEWTELVWQFREISDRYDGWAVFYEVGQRNLDLYLDLGLTLQKLGEEACVRLETFSLEGGERKNMRYVTNKLGKEGCRFEVLPPGKVASLMPELKAISDSWLDAKKTREKGFSLGFFDPIYMRQFPVGVVYKDERIVAFANIWPAAEKKELSIDLMRYGPEAPRDVMEYLFVQLMLWGKQEGYKWFSLGMAPLSGLADHELAPLWSRIGALVFRYGEDYYNFQGLRQYKNKFGPEWRPKYLASPSGLALPRILTNLASLVSGGLRGVVTK
jgi:phosphatidylglycerol lysyltransferase